MFKEMATGLGVTFENLFKKPFTVQYPDEQLQMTHRFRGKHILARHEDGLERCVGCELCAVACPADAIFVKAAENDPANPVSHGERYAERYEINMLRCIFCGMCEEACPVDAVELTSMFDLTGRSREEMIFDKEKLLSVYDQTKDAEPMKSRVMGASP